MDCRATLCPEVYNHDTYTILQYIYSVTNVLCASVAATFCQASVLLVIGQRMRGSVKTWMHKVIALFGETQRMLMLILALSITFFIKEPDDVLAWRPNYATSDPQEIA